MAYITCLISLFIDLTGQMIRKENETFFSGYKTMISCKAGALNMWNQSFHIFK